MPPYRRAASVLLAAALLAGPALPIARAAEIPADAVHAGIYPEGSGDPAHPIDAATITEVAVWGGPPTFSGLFHNLDETIRFTSLANVTLSMLTAAWAAGTTPFSNVDYLDTAQSILDGRHSGSGAVNDIDERIDRWAGEVKRFLEGENLPGENVPAAGRSLIIAPLQETNGTWTPYGCYRSGGVVVREPAEYRSAFRKIVDRVEAVLGPALRDKVRWSFAPNGVSSPGCGPIADYYPGDDYVDVIGVSAFNLSGISGTPWTDVPQTFQGPLDVLRATVDNSKPYIVAQTGSPSSGGDKNAWIAAMFPYLAADPNVVGFVWFNIDKFEGSPPTFVDWKCCPDDDYPAWPEGMALPTTRYAWPLADWFQPGPLPFTPTPLPPTAVDDAFTLGEGDELALPVTSNDPDGNFDPLVAIVVTPPAHGTATANPDGSVTYRHDASETVADSFGYRVTDGTFTSDPATVQLTITPRPDALVGLMDPAEGRWHLRAEDGAVNTFYYGNPGDQPMLGDWDCDGIDTPGLYRQDDGFVYLRNSNTVGIADIRFFFGDPGDVPLAGDFDGDGCDTVSLYRPSEGRVYVINELGQNDGGLGAADFAYFFGSPGDKPFAADFDGDGVATVGLHRESTGLVYLRQTNTAGPADEQFIYGDPGDRLVAADWIGAGRATVGIFRPSDRTFYLRHDNASGAADEVIPFGEEGWLPVAGVF